MKRTDTQTDRQTDKQHGNISNILCGFVEWKLYTIQKFNIAMLFLCRFISVAFKYLNHVTDCYKSRCEYYDDLGWNNNALIFNFLPSVRTMWRTCKLLRCENFLLARRILRATGPRSCVKTSLSLCCIPAVSWRRTCRRFCSRAWAELEHWLRPGCEGPLVPTITRCTKCMEFIVSK
jgi:hypothetical protein